MSHTVTWLDRLRIERAVWALDQRLYDLPRRTRIETRREVRQNLLVGSRDVGTTEALRNLGNSSELARGYLSAAFGSGPRHSWMAAAVFALAVPFLALPLFNNAATAFANGITAADPNATGTYTWDGISHLQSTVTYTFVSGDGTWTGGAFTPLFYLLWIIGTVLVGRLWRALPAWRKRHAPAAYRSRPSWMSDRSRHLSGDPQHWRIRTYCLQDLLIIERECSR